MADKKIHTIRINGQLTAVTEEVYRAYHRMGRRERYLDERDLMHGKVLYSQLDDGETTGEDMIPDLDAESVEDIAIRRVMTDRLRLCLRLLTEDELTLIVKRYYVEHSHYDVAAELGFNQSTICRKEEKVLAKLRSLLEK
jgi:RNA polymerase sigma factor (sigma-70 family)